MKSSKMELFKKAVHKPQNRGEFRLSFYGVKSFHLGPIAVIEENYLELNSPSAIFPTWGRANFPKNGSKHVFASTRRICEPISNFLEFFDSSRPPLSENVGNFFLGKGENFGSHFRSIFLFFNTCEKIGEN